MKACFPAAALLCISNPIQAAAPATRADIVVVRIADLDLGRPEGRAALDTRLAAAALRVCRAVTTTGPIDWVGRTPCYREVLAQARERAAVIIAAAEARTRLARNAQSR